MNFILASGNAHKAEEFNQLFSEDVINITAAAERLDVVEDGKSYQANALLKAEAYFKKFKTPVMSDDSGLTVVSLPDELGIHSARFGGEGLTDQQRYELLLEKLRPGLDRTAYFTCVLCFYIAPQEIFFFEGRLSGSIAEEPMGTEGFGYDPVFVAEGQSKSIATMPDWKAKNSHRSRAVEAAMRFFAERNCQK